MGIIDRLGLGKRTSDLLAHGGAGGYLASPFQADTLEQVTFADFYEGIDITASLPLSRAQAITIPAVSKARNLLVGTIAKFPLRALDENGLSATQPEFLYRSSTSVTPYERMAWTVDDLIFYGVSLWVVERDADGLITEAAWVPSSTWTITDGWILIDGKAVNESDVILFNSPFEGLLNLGGRTLRGAIDTESAWVGRARNPIPMTELHQTDDSLTPEQVQKFVKAWSAARRSVDGAVGYTPEGIEIRVHGEVRADLMVEGRNAIRTDVGSFVNVRASMLDGTAGVDSLTYTTNEGEKNSFYDFDLPFWTDPIEARLSMDDVIPSPERIRFDKYDAYNLPTPTGPTVKD